MSEERFKRELAGYISLALATVFPTATANEQINSADQNDSAIAEELVNQELSAVISLGSLDVRELSSLEMLSRKYEEVKRFFPKGIEDLSSAAFPTLSDESRSSLFISGLEQRGSQEIPQEFPMGLDPRVVAISQDQYKTAVEVHRLADAASTAFREGRQEEARSNYDELASLLEKKREALYGGFQTIDQLEEAVGAYAVGRNADPQAAGGGAVIFVVIEIYVNS